VGIRRRLLHLVRLCALSHSLMVLNSPTGLPETSWKCRSIESAAHISHFPESERGGAIAGLGVALKNLRWGVLSFDCLELECPEISRLKSNYRQVLFGKSKEQGNGGIGSITVPGGESLPCSSAGTCRATYYVLRLLTSRVWVNIKKKKTKMNVVGRTMVRFDKLKGSAFRYR
jgi:hypothetical protein